MYFKWSGHVFCFLHLLSFSLQKFLLQSSADRLFFDRFASLRLDGAMPEKYSYWFCTLSETHKTVRRSCTMTGMFSSPFVSPPWVRTEVKLHCCCWLWCRSAGASSSWTACLLSDRRRRSRKGKKSYFAVWSELWVKSHPDQYSRSSVKV